MARKSRPYIHVSLARDAMMNNNSSDSVSIMGGKHGRDVVAASSGGPNNTQAKKGGSFCCRRSSVRVLQAWRLCLLSLALLLTSATIVRFYSLFPQGRDDGIRSIDLDFVAEDSGASVFLPNATTTTSPGSNSSSRRREAILMHRQDTRNTTPAFRRNETATYEVMGRTNLTDSTLLGKVTTSAAALQRKVVRGESSSSSSSATKTRTGAGGGSAATGAKYAYAFVIGGCHPEGRASYQNYVYNILIAAKLLRERGSKADVVALFQLKSESNHSRLPPRYSLALEKMNVKVGYIPKSNNENFYRTNVDKFRILGLTQYRRALFMDGDIMPVGSLDFLFEMSDEGTLKENVVMQGVWEPANGGFFMLSPSADDMMLLNTIVQRREEFARNNPYPYFDFVKGWGHAIIPPDKWEGSSGQSGTNWTFLAGFADQGLLYHWVKYVKKSVSIIQRDCSVRNWGVPEARRAAKNSSSAAADDPMVVLQETMGGDIFRQRSSRLIKCFKHCRTPPRSHFYHFTGTGKPWLRGPPGDLSEETRLRSASHLWFHTLGILNQELDLELNFSHWVRGKQQRPLLGLYPVYAEAKNANSNLLEQVDESGTPAR